MNTARTNRRQFISGIIAMSAVTGTAASASVASAQSSSAVVWTAEAGGAIRAYEVSDTSVFVGTDQNRLRMVDRQTGETQARLDLDAGVYTDGIEVTPEHIIVATEDDRLTMYRRGDIGSESAEPVYRSQLSGRPMGMDSKEERVVIATRETLSLFDLRKQSFAWQIAASDFEFKDWAAFGPPIVWTQTDILAVAGQGIVFLSPETGEQEVYITHGGGYQNGYTATNRPPIATSRDGSYVSFHGWDAHGCCPSWASMVVNTDTRDWEYRKFEGFNQSNEQDSGAVVGETVIHQFGENRTLFRDLNSEEEFETSYFPRFDGIASTTSRTFIADRSIDGVTTQLVAVSNDGYGLEWSADFDDPISRLQVRGEYLFGINESEGRLFAVAQSGDGASLRSESSTPTAGDATVDATPTATGSGAASTDGAADIDSDGSRSGDGAQRGFLTNGDGSAIQGVGIREFSTAITALSIIIGLAQLMGGEN